MFWSLQKVCIKGGERLPNASDHSLYLSQGLLVHRQTFNLLICDLILIFDAKAHLFSKLCSREPVVQIDEWAWISDLHQIWP